jgi:hypothetical protein
MPIADLAVLVPSRGRPENLARLITEVHRTARGRTHVLAGVDQDDPRLKDYMALRKTVLAPGDYIHTSAQRRNLVQWTNHLAHLEQGKYRFYASLGDDMVPRTPGWDVRLMGAIDEDFGGVGFSYPWDGVRDDIPEAYVASAEIPDALGWLMMPKLSHWYNDNVIADLGHGAGCIRQLRGVIIDHLNVGMGKAPADQTAIDAGKGIPSDQQIYNEWRRADMLTDVGIVKELTWQARGRSRHPSVASGATSTGRFAQKS